MFFPGLECVAVITNTAATFGTLLSTVIRNVFAGLLVVANDVGFVKALSPMRDRLEIYLQFDGFRAETEAGRKLGFEGNKEQTLEIGKSPEFKPEVYARIAGTQSVFTLPKTTVDSLTAGAAGLIPDSKLVASRARANAASSPIPSPNAASRRPWPTTIESRSAGRAPIATRTPSSRVRWLTE